MARRPKSVDPQLRLLKAAAESLAEGNIVAHPSLVGLVRYDPKDRSAQYTRLYSDWNDPINHWQVKESPYTPTFHRRLGELLEHPAEVFPEPIRSKAMAFRSISQTRHLVTSVSDELKKIRFYLPQIADLYAKAKSNGRSSAGLEFDSGQWSVTPRDNERRQLEQANNCVGHWALGVILEAWYLCSHQRLCCAAYFVRDRETGDLLAIHANCAKTEDVEQIERIHSIVNGFSRFRYNPFTEWKPKPSVKLLTPKQILERSSGAALQIAMERVLHPDDDPVESWQEIQSSVLPPIIDEHHHQFVELGNWFMRNASQSQRQEFMVWMRLEKSKLKPGETIPFINVWNRHSSALRGVF